MKRRLIIISPNGQQFGREAIDLSDQPNADARAPFTGMIQVQCNMGSWHGTETFPLPNWDEEPRPKR